MDHHLTDVFAEELALEKWQYEERSGAYKTPELQQKYLEVDCLVHSDWINSVSSPDQPIPRHSPPFSQEEIHWMLQPSCWSLPDHPWKRVHICCFKRPDLSNNTPRRRYLVPQSLPNTDSIHAFLTFLAHETTLSYWRNFQSNLDKTNNCKETDTKPQLPVTPLTNLFMSQMVKALFNKQLRPLLPVPSKESSNTTPTTTPISSPSLVIDKVDSKASGQENLSPLIGAIESSNAFYLIYEYNRFTLFDCISHSPAMLDGSAKSLFVVYQLLRLVSYCHSNGMTLGDINLNNIYIDSRLWVQYYIPPVSLISTSSQNNGEKCPENSTPTPENGSTTQLDTSMEPILKKSNEGPAEYVPPSLSLADSVSKWRSGELSNFDYIMLLNYHVGRRLGDPNNHPIFPWVTDFEFKNGNIRDLSCSKHRLAKGDTQLDFTYGASNNELLRKSPTSFGTVVPHHIGDIASDVTYYVYKARQTTKDVLCSRVRPNWVPEQYPVSIEKMYSWTPDEAIPEFYTSPEIFYSIHPDLPDLEVPNWCSSPDEFIRIHRNLLESDHVSAHLNHWIDITFGCKLSGESSVKAKNVYLSLVDSHTSLCNSGIVQLFRSAHPKKVQNYSAPFVIFNWQRYLGMSSLTNLTTFDIPFIGIHHNTKSSNNMEDEGKRFTALLESNCHRLHDMKGTRSGIDDGSFEHVPYPQDIDEHIMVGGMTPDQSVYNVSHFYDDGMLNRQSKALGGRQTFDPNNTPLDKQPLRLKGILQRSKRPISIDISSEAYDWQINGISFPPTSQPLQPLADIEELGFFLNKSCNDYGDLCQRWWNSEDLLMLQKAKMDSSLSQKILNLFQSMDNGGTLSYEERALLDIVAVICVAMEITANKYIRSTLPVHGSLTNRYSSIRQLMINGRLSVPYCLQVVSDLLFLDKTDTSVKLLDIFPSFNSSTLVQQFIPLVSFPCYFDKLYNTLSELETKSKSIGLSFIPMKRRIQIKSLEQPKDVSSIITFLTEECHIIFPLLDQEGIGLLMQYIQPLFEHPMTSFEAVSTLFELVTSFLGQRLVQQLFLIPFLNVFDNFSNPIHRYNLFNRNIGNSLIKNFGLNIFLSRFLNCFIEAVIEPMGHKLNPTSQIMAAKKPLLYDDDNLLKHDSNITDNSRSSLSHRIDLSHASNPLSPTGTNTAKHSLTYDNWREGHSIHSDEEDSDVEEFGFPDVSLFETKNTPASSVSVFGLLADMEEIRGQSDNDVTGNSPFGKSESDSVLSPKSDIKSSQYGDDSEFLQTSILPSVISQSMRPSLLSLPIQEHKEEDNHSLTGSEYQSSAISETSLPTTTTIIPSPNRQSYDMTPSIDESVPEEEVLEEGERGEEVPTETTAVDPQLLLMSQHISEVASDCLVWLLWRLGPLLSTKHIISPLLNNIHRCFSGVCKLENNLTSNKSALLVMSSFIEYYGEETIGRLFVPFIKQQVTGQLKRSIISVKAESCIAASIALCELVTKKTKSNETLLGLMEELSSSYFQSFFTLLASSQHVFPSGAKARLTLCHDLVLLMRQICARLGSSRSAEVLMDVLKCFFDCYSTAHGKVIHNVNSLSPVEEYFSQTNEINTLLNTSSISEPSNNVAVKQVLETFSPDFVHETYVHFCKLIGQIQMSKHLNNIDAIEDLHALYSGQMRKSSDRKSPIARPSILLGLTDQNVLESSTSSDESSDGSFEFDLGYQLGPSQANQGKSGLGRDSSGFGGPSWFVDMDDTRPVNTTQTGSHSTVLQTGTHSTVSQTGSQVTTGSHSTRQNLSTGSIPQISKTQSEGGVGGVAPTQLVTENAVLDKSTAIFEAKFKPISRQLFENNTTDQPTHEEHEGDIDCTLRGEWTNIWSQHAFRDRKYDSYEKFEGIKLQSYTGHRSAIKSISVLDSEHLFVSGSKDKTVKIWSLYNEGDGSASLLPRLTYVGHQKPVTKVDVVNQQNVVSCDGGSVHLWDIETNYCLHQFVPTKLTTQFLTMDTISDSPHQLIVATSDFNLRFIDLRTKTFQHSWRTFFPMGGSIRFLASHGNWVAVGNINCLVNVFDLRTGEINQHWKPVEKSPYSQYDNLVNLKTTPRGNILTSAGTGLISLWKPNSKPLNHLRGHNVTTPCLEIFDDHLVTITASGSVLVHASYENTQDNIVSSCRLRMKGNVTCSSALKLSQLLLLGNESGQIILTA